MMLCDDRLVRSVGKFRCMLHLLLFQLQIIAIASSSYDVISWQRKLLQQSRPSLEKSGIQYCSNIVNHDAVTESDALEKAAELAIAFYRAQQRPKCLGGQLVVQGGEAGGNDVGLVQACQSKLDSAEYRMLLNTTVDCQSQGGGSNVKIVYLDARVRIQPQSVSSVFEVDPALYIDDGVKLGVGKLSIFEIEQPADACDDLPEEFTPYVPSNVVSLAEMAVSEYRQQLDNRCPAGLHIENERAPEYLVTRSCMDKSNNNRFLLNFNVTIFCIVVGSKAAGQGTLHDEVFEADVVSFPPGVRILQVTATRDRVEGPPVSGFPGITHTVLPVQVDRGSLAVAELQDPQEFVDAAYLAQQGDGDLCSSVAYFMPASLSQISRLVSMGLTRYKVEQEESQRCPGGVIIDNENFPRTLLPAYCQNTQVSTQFLVLFNVTGRCVIDGTKRRGTYVPVRDQFVILLNSRPQGVEFFALLNSTELAESVLSPQPRGNPISPLPQFEDELVNTSVATRNETQEDSEQEPIQEEYQLIPSEPEEVQEEQLLPQVEYTQPQPEAPQDDISPVIEGQQEQEGTGQNQTFGQGETPQSETDMSIPLEEPLIEQGSEVNLPFIVGDDGSTRPENVTFPQPEPEEEDMEGGIPLIPENATDTPSPEGEQVGLEGEPDSIPEVEEPSQIPSLRRSG
eukprot:TRINITY_DN9340_c1_g1_i3.p1 TRINITY_DN9340_c1_g1~~TRINITY_DN9340_c1_g1_i3.p1  ORF type:complete len:680 (-),score=93.19 TRINITY_DN9340_c1_g1_i3:40-2079(-)